MNHCSKLCNAIQGTPVLLEEDATLGQKQAHGLQILHLLCHLLPKRF